jgi:chromosomal replication initiator protein
MKRNVFITWFQNTGAVKLENGVLSVGFPHTFAKQWAEIHCMSKILSLVKSIDASIQEVQFVIEASFANGSDPRAVPLDAVLVDTPSEKPTMRKVANVQEVRIEGGLRSKILNPRYTLDGFIAGRNNRLPHAAAAAVGHQPGGTYNPLFIYGQVGLGKTHLLQATGNEILKNFPNKIVAYITSEQFVNEVVEAIRTRKVKELKDRYRKADCLLVDDVQFFGEKTSSQEEFFHTFNALYDANKQIVLSSDRAPKDMEFVDDRLRSRFGMGMVTEVLAPEYETRLAILQNKCQELGVLIDQEVLSAIAYNVEDSVRHLEGALKGLVGTMQLEQKVPTVQDALQIVQRIRGDAVSMPPTGGGGPSQQQQAGHFSEGSRMAPASNRRFVRDPEEVIAVVAKYYRISRQDLVGDDRRREILVPRQVCMYLIRSELNEAYEKIGADFGGKNHTTILHACNKIVEQLKADQRLVRDVQAIRTELGL